LYDYDIYTYREAESLDCSDILKMINMYRSKKVKVDQTVDQTIYIDLWIGIGTSTYRLKG